MYGALLDNIHKRNSVLPVMTSNVQVLH